MRKYLCVGGTLHGEICSLSGATEISFPITKPTQPTSDEHEKYNLEQLIVNNMSIRVLVNDSLKLSDRYTMTLVMEAMIEHFKKTQDLFADNICGKDKPRPYKIISGEV